MKSTCPADPAAARSEARRAQILAAARDCFRQQGFHGASIAQICRSAGMSAGHIYHYFENKEAIIAAIVEQDLDRLLTLTAELRAATDILPTIAVQTAAGVTDNLEPDTAALRVEIVAEAARNPRVAEIVHAADQRCRASVVEVLRQHRQQLGLSALPAARLEAMADLFATMYDGLLIRAVRNPGLGREALTEQFRHIIVTTLTAPDGPPGSTTS